MSQLKRENKMIKVEYKVIITQARQKVDDAVLRGKYKVDTDKVDYPTYLPHKREARPSTSFTYFAIPECDN